MLAGDRTQRRLFRWLPYDRITANEPDHRVPCPHCNRKVKCRNDADRSKRMPIFGESMPGPLARDCLAVKLPAQTDGEITNVDHFLHFATRFWQNFPGLERDKRRQL